MKRVAKGRNEEGFALISVLWGVMILSLIAGSLLAAGILDYRIERNGLERARLELLAEAGINRAILALLDPRPGKSWRVDGHAYDVDYSGAHISVKIQDELGKIDLNAADRGRLLSLALSVGLDSDQADVVVDRILDWREPGDLKRLNGAKAKDYREAGISYGPRGGPFQSIDELKLVLGVTRDLFARLKPALTIYSHSKFVRQETAPREVLMALPGMDDTKINLLLAAREAGWTALTDGGGSNAVNGILAENDIIGRAFTISAEVADDGRRRVTREIVVQITDDPARPYWVLASN